MSSDHPPSGWLFISTSNHIDISLLLSKLIVLIVSCYIFSCSWICSTIELGSFSRTVYLWVWSVIFISVWTIFSFPLLMKMAGLYNLFESVTLYVGNMLSIGVPITSTCRS